jgi:regulator of sirC expression with transglutaminase-like and TPR domain
VLLTGAFGVWGLALLLLTRSQPITKRRIALLRSLGRTSDAVNALNALLDFSPTDPEAWSELADIYASQGLYGQAIYALEEVLVLMPNAWNVRTHLCLSSKPG